MSNNSCCENTQSSRNTNVCDNNCSSRSNNGFIILIVLYILLAIILGSRLY